MTVVASRITSARDLRGAPSRRCTWEGFRTSLLHPEAFDLGAASLGRYRVSYEPDSLGRLRFVRGPAELHDLTAAGDPRSLAAYDYLGGRVWSRAYDNGAVLRFFDEQSGMSLLDGLGRVTGMVTRIGAEAQPIACAEDRSLEKQEWLAFTKQVRVSGFWDARSFDESRGVDGAEWLVEGLRDGQYSAVLRWSPKEGPFRELCLEMLKLAGGDFAPVY